MDGRLLQDIHEDLVDLRSLGKWILLELKKINSQLIEEPSATKLILGQPQKQ
jgi:hypothetical protein